MRFSRVRSWRAPFCLVLSLTISSALEAQSRRPEPATRSGTLVSVSQGRVQTVTYTDEEGVEQQVVVTPKVQAYAQAPGDAGFLQPGQFIAALATESNQKLFTGKVSVVIFGKGRPPAGRIQKAPPQPGQSKNTYQVTGTIKSVGPDADYPEYQRLELNVAGPRAPLMLEKDVEVTVRTPDLTLAAPGTPLELEGVELRNGRFNVIKLTAQLDEPLKASEVIGEPGDQQP